MDVRPAGPAEAEYVAAHMWQRGRDELGMDEGELRRHFQSYGALPETHAIFDDGVPIACCGAIELAPRHFYTWFQATDAFVRKGVRATVLFRKFVAGWMAARPGIVLDACSAGAHPDTERWFAALGFHPVERTDEYVRYRYNVEFVECKRSTT